jgi:hypothetical protein
MVIYKTHERKRNINRVLFRKPEWKTNADVDEEDNIKVHVKSIGYGTRFVKFRRGWG